MKNNRIEFTLEMKKDYTILIPNMLNIHFRLIKEIFENDGYKCELLQNDGANVVSEGLKYVHNDTCYPALLVIGQMIDALKSGKYDINKVALMITQTGGGCRASNYIHLLRKALAKAGLEFIPVISLSANGLEKNSGFKFTLPLIRFALASIVYGDMMMLLNNQVMPYEINKGDCNRLIEGWIKDLSAQFKNKKGYKKRHLEQNLKAIAKDFSNVIINKTNKIKVGIVGEIYVKYSPLANNKLEEFLVNQGCEVMTPGLMGFMMYALGGGVFDHLYYGGNGLKLSGTKILMAYLTQLETSFINAIKVHPQFTPPASYKELQKYAQKVIGLGCKMGEGWLLTGEMVELINHGYSNIICAQPFGCLPNHIIGKGMIRKLKQYYIDSNIVPIDYDPSATSVNQENRIKLMLAVAKERLTKANTSLNNSKNSTHSSFSLHH